MVGDRGITKDEYDKKLKELKERQHEIDTQLQDHTNADENYYITASTVLNLAKNALTLFESLGKSSNVLKQRALLNYILQNCTTHGKKLEFTLRSPFNTIFELTSTSWAPVTGYVQNSVIERFRALDWNSIKQELSYFEIYSQQTSFAL